ncbi:glycosyltransferase [Falsiroseomonas sp.]|uniref:glycosyltransferase n=1 Tax=Falsiroseomonas sp. TaxID=2870721 RepID=UPI002734B877|nr:glycosyltransferase [Falsiroseomonas sp.]MDP3414617.1 glycosyltransferase [Falsiroseomonas sp.]
MKTSLQKTSRASAHDIAAAIVVFQPDLDVLIALLDTIAQDGRRIFLFLNDLSESEVARLVDRVTNVRCLRSPQNVGLGAGLNWAMEAAAEEGFAYVVLFDQDSSPAPSLFEDLAVRHAAHTDRGAAVAVIGPLLVPAEGAYRAIRYEWRDAQEGTASFVPTSGSLMLVKAWRSIGPFRDDYFVGAIDVEWCFRAWAMGWKCLVARDVTMPHRWGSPAADGKSWKPQILRHSDTRTYFHFRNSLDCIRLPHPPLRWKISAALTLAAQAALLLAARGFSRVTRRYLWLGLRDGWVGRLGPLPGELAAAQQTSV